MHSHPKRFTALALAFISSLALLPLSSHAQAGLSGNPLEGQMEEMRGKAGNFGSGNQSALGQLEEISGRKVSRTSPQRTKTTRIVPPPRPAAPRYNSDQVLKQQFRGALAGALVGALFSNLLNDNSAAQRQAQAEAEARARAEAAAQAEAFRVQQELARQARIRQAQHYRADWDAREADITNRLGGAFELRTGTSFFGQSATLDPAVLAALRQVGDPGQNQSPSANISSGADSDPSVVDLSDSSLVVDPLRAGVIPKTMPARSSGSLMPRWAWDWAAPSEPPPPPPRASQLRGLLAYFGPWLRDWYKDFGTNTVNETRWGRQEHSFFQEANKARKDFNEQQSGLEKEMNEAYDPVKELFFSGATNAANALGSGDNRGGDLADRQFDALQLRGGKVVVDAWSMAFKQFTGHFGPVDLNKVKKVSLGDGNVRPLNDVPVHVDLARLLYGSRGE